MNVRLSDKKKVFDFNLKAGNKVVYKDSKNRWTSNKLKSLLSSGCTLNKYKFGFVLSDETGHALAQGEDVLDIIIKIENDNEVTKV